MGLGILSHNRESFMPENGDPSTDPIVVTLSLILLFQNGGHIESANDRVRHEHKCLVS